MGRPTCQLPHARITRGGFGAQSDPAAPRAHPDAPTESWPAPPATPRDSLSFRLCFQQQPLTCPTSHVCAPIFRRFPPSSRGDTGSPGQWAPVPAPVIAPSHLSTAAWLRGEKNCFAKAKLLCNLSNTGVKAHGPQRRRRASKFSCKRSPRPGGILPGKLGACCDECDTGRGSGELHPVPFL